MTLYGLRGRVTPSRLTARARFAMHAANQLWVIGWNGYEVGAIVEMWLRDYDARRAKTGRGG